MTKYEMITKGINLNKEAQKLEEQKKEYILNMISAESSIRKKWSEFATVFLTEEVLQEIEKIYGDSIVMYKDFDDFKKNYQKNIVR